MRTSNSVQDLLARAIASVSKSVNKTGWPQTLEDILKVQPMQGSFPAEFPLNANCGSPTGVWGTLTKEQGIARVKEMCCVTNDEIAYAIFSEICRQEIIDPRDPLFVNTSVEEGEVSKVDVLHRLGIV
jgi:hypothetical protein